MKGANDIWHKQTINNACGLYGILHAVCNGDTRNGIRDWNILNRSSKMKMKMNVQKSCNRRILISSEDAPVTVYRVRADCSQINRMGPQLRIYLVCSKYARR